MNMIGVNAKIDVDLFLFSSIRNNVLDILKIDKKHLLPTTETFQYHIAVGGVKYPID